MVNPRKTRHDYLLTATEEELINELVQRRQKALTDCSDEEIEAELATRPGVDRGVPLPKIVEK